MVADARRHKRLEQSLAEARQQAAAELESVQRQFRAYQAAKGQEVAQLEGRLRSALSGLDAGAARKEKDGSGGVLRRPGVPASQGGSRTGKRKFWSDLSLHDGRFASSLLPQGGPDLLPSLLDEFADGFPSEPPSPRRRPGLPGKLSGKPVLGLFR